MISIIFFWGERQPISDIVGKIKLTIPPYCFITVVILYSFELGHKVEIKLKSSSFTSDISLFDWTDSEFSLLLFRICWAISEYASSILDSTSFWNRWLAKIKSVSLDADEKASLRPK